MKRLLAGVAFGGVVLAGLTGWGQTHKVTKPEQVVRAVGVYEWTGEIAKPTASRLVPVTLYIEGKLEDAGVYIARPVPFALLQGNVYELQDAGVSKGTLELAYAKHIQTPDQAFDDGWFGYGTFRAAVAAKKPTALKASKTLPVITSSSDSSKPHLSTKGGDTASGSSGQAADPDRPTMQRRDSGAGTGSTSTDTAGGSSGSQGAPADDPDRPTMKRRPAGDSGSGSGSGAGSGAGSSGDTTAGSGSGGGDNSSANDPDRPTLKRHSAEDAKKAAQNDVASVTSVGSLNDDPDRPNLHHGKPTSAMTDADLPKLVGLPPEAHQMVAVSDAVSREPHPFTLAWTDAAERAAVLEKLQGMARAQLAGYGGAPAAAAPAVKKTPAAGSAARRTTAAAKPVAEALLDEDLKAYTLSYGGAATYVYMAHTAGTGAALRYVTVVAQADALGDLKPALQNVTDAAHLDRTPRMKFVDVVDAEASNRASLLFEMREQSSRQFALYRVIATKAELVFLTGTTQ